MKNGDLISTTVVASDSASGATFNMVHNYRVTNTDGVASTFFSTIGAIYQNKIRESNRSGRFNLNFLAFMPKTLTFNRVEMFNRNTPDEAGIYNMGDKGTSISQAYNPRAATFFRTRTGQRGRTRTGKMFYPPVTEGYLEAGNLADAAYIVILEAFADELRIMGNTEEQAILTVWSRKLSTETVFFNNPVTRVNVSIAMASQRRRRKHLT